MARDILISYKLSEHHFRTLYFRRSTEDTLTDKELVYKSLNEFIETETDSLIPDYDSLSTLISIMNMDNISEIVAGMNYLKYYIHIFHRLDIEDSMSTIGTDDFAVRVYLVNPDNTAIGIMSMDPQSSSTSDCIMNMYIQKLAIDPEIGKIIKIQFGLDSYNALVDSGAGFEFDASQFYNYITTDNKRLLIFVK